MELVSGRGVKVISRTTNKLLFSLFLGLVCVYGLVAWERVLEPSPQFHFVDLAHSFMSGRLDTDTPTQPATRELESDPAGYREIIKRTRASGGWNDWAALKTLTLKDGTTLKGHFPYLDASGEKRHTFHTLDGQSWVVDVGKDLASSCPSAPGGRCNATEHFVSFPPMPAVVMLPAAAIWGYHANDVLLTILFAALNGVLLLMLLELLVQRGYSTRTLHENLWLTLACCVGSVVFFASVRGEVWFTALVFGLTFNLCFALAALDTRHPILAGLMLGLGMATRTPIAFCFVFFAWQLFFPAGRLKLARWSTILIRGSQFALPVLLCGGLLIAYNLARFDQPTEFGHSLLGGGAGRRIRDHGLFNFFYLNGNLAAALVNLPRLSTEAPFISITKHGLSLLFTTPLLCLLVAPRARSSIDRALWLTVFAVAIPGLLYQNTGWEQFGYRFAMDYMPFLFMLLAVGARPLTVRVKALIILGIAVNLFGAITFGRFDQFYY